MARRLSVRISIVVSLIALLSIVGAGTASAAAPNPPNCMAVDMSTWAREGSTFFGFTSGAGWGGFIAQNAQDPTSIFGQDTLGHAMVVHLAGGFYGAPGVTCQPA